MMKINKKAIFMAILFLSLVFVGYKFKIEYNKHVEKENVNRLLIELKEKGLDPDTIRKKENDRLTFTNNLKTNINNEVEKLAKQLQSQAFKEKVYVKRIKERYGIKSNNYKVYTMTLSFYTDLNCENGFGPITATGKRLTNGQIANNQLPFGTKVYIDGHGMKTVEDRGSKRYFNTVTKVDVFVPRNAGESDSAYWRRVNNMGKIKAKAIVFE